MAVPPGPSGPCGGARAASCCGVALPGLGGGTWQLAAVHLVPPGEGGRTRTMLGTRVLDPTPCITVLKMLLKVKFTVVTAGGHRGGTWQGRSLNTALELVAGPGQTPTRGWPHGGLCRLAGGAEEAQAEASGVVVPSRSTDETQRAGPPSATSVVRPVGVRQTWPGSRAWGGRLRLLSARTSGFAVVLSCRWAVGAQGPAHLATAVVTS